MWIDPPAAQTEPAFRHGPAFRHEPAFTNVHAFYVVYLRHEPAFTWTRIHKWTCIRKCGQTFDVVYAFTNAVRCLMWYMHSQMNLHLHHTWTSGMNLHSQMWWMVFMLYIRHEPAFINVHACVCWTMQVHVCSVHAHLWMHARMHAQPWVHAHPWVKWTLPMHAHLCIQTPWTNSWVYHGTVVKFIWCSNHMTDMVEMEVHYITCWNLWNCDIICYAKIR